MLVIGLTGGIGTGKSTVADLFAKHGVPIIDADVIAREITKPNHSAFSEIVTHFGPAILENNQLDRRRLRNIVFSNKDERLWLEKLLHPLIEQDIIRQIQTLAAPYCIVVIPLLVEVAPYGFVNRILVVDSPHSLQINRVMTRDNTEEAQVKSIIESQATREQRLEKADDVIINEGSLANLATQVENLHQKYTKMSQIT